MMQQPRQRRRRRPRNILIAAAEFAVVAYGTYRLAKFAWDTYFEEEDDPDADDGLLTPYNNSANRSSNNNLNVKMIQLRRCRVEASRALVDFLPHLKVRIQGIPQVDAAEAVKCLKAIRKSKRNNNGSDDTATKEAELWEVVKVRAVTKFFVSAYSFVLLFLVLTVQVHLLGSKKVKDQLIDADFSPRQEDDNTGTIDADGDSLLREGDDDEMGETSIDAATVQERHHLVLKCTYDYFFQHGLPALSQAIETAVLNCMAGWDMSNLVDVKEEDFIAVLNDIRNTVEVKDDNNVRPASNKCVAKLAESSALLQYIVQNAESVEIDDPSVRYVLDETWDIVESPAFGVALTECLKSTLQISREGLLVFRSTPNPPSLAQVVTQLKQTAGNFFVDEINAVYLTQLATLPTVHELGLASFDFGS